MDSSGSHKGRSMNGYSYVVPPSRESCFSPESCNRGVRSTLHVLRRLPLADVLLLGVVLFSTSCSNTHASLKSQDLQIQSTFPAESAADTSNYLWNPRRFELVDSLVVVTDGNRNFVSVYGLDGTFRGTVGEYGQGPGEFINPGPIRSDPLTKGVWIASNSRFTLLDADLKYVSSFQPPAGVHGFDVLPDGSLAISITPSNTRGSLLKLSRSGEVLWDASPALSVGDFSPLAGFYCMSDVVTVGSEIWQVYTFFNVIRAYTSEGQLVREFSVQHQLATRRHERNLDQLERRRTGDRSAGPSSVFMAARFSGGSIWLVGTFPAPESDRYPPIHYLSLDSTGRATELYALQNEEIRQTSDVMAFGRVDHRRLLILAARPPRLLWCQIDRLTTR